MAVVAVVVPTPEEMTALDGSELDRVMMDLEIARRRIEAAVADVVDRCDQSGHYLSDGHRSVKGWAMATTNCSPSEALRRQQAARAMRSLPVASNRFRSGEVGVAQMHELGRLASNPRCSDQLPASEHVLLDAATQLEYVDFRVVAQRWEQLADADGAHRHHDARHERRNARLVEHDGEFRWETSHGVVQGAGMREIFEQFCDAEFRADWDATVAEHGTDARKDLMPRTTAQRRADALVAVFEAAASAGVAGQPIKAVLNLIMDVDSFEQYTREQIDDTPASIDPASVRDRRCETTDGIPVDPRQAVALAFLGKIRRIVLDQHGVIVAAGRQRRLFDGALREAIKAIDPRCLWLGCTLRAAIAEIDHLKPHTDGGLTDAANGKVMCKRHNLHKHTHGYVPQRVADGTWVMLRPDGTHMRPPDAA